MVTPLSLTLDTTTLSMERYCTFGLGVGFGGVGVGGTGSGDGCLPLHEEDKTIRQNNNSVVASPFLYDCTTDIIRPRLLG